MKKIKNEKGITLVTLTITIVVLMILSFSINVSVKLTMETRNYNYVKEDIINLSEEVKAYYLKNNSLPIDETKTYNLADYGVPSEDINPNDYGNYYRINVSLLENISLNNGGINNNEANEETDDMYVVNEYSLTVYYLKGATFGGQKHYTITDDFAEGGTAKDFYTKVEYPIFPAITLKSNNSQDETVANTGEVVTLKMISRYKQENFIKLPTVKINGEDVSDTLAWNNNIITAKYTIPEDSAKLGYGAQITFEISDYSVKGEENQTINGQTITEVNFGKTVTRKYVTLVQAFEEGNIKVGDYLNYNDYVDKSKTYTTVTSENGWGDQKYIATKETYWQVLGLDETGKKLMLISQSPIKKEMKTSGTTEKWEKSPYLVLKGAKGYINSKKVLNNISGIYSTNLGTAQSITAEEINRLIGVTVDYKNKKVYANSNPNTNLDILQVLGNQYTYKTGDYTPQGYVNNKTKATEGTKTSPATAYIYEWSGLKIDATLQNMLFDKTTKADKNAKSYWLASPSVGADSNGAFFDPGSVVNGKVQVAGTLFFSYDAWCANCYAVRPIVYLNSNITIEDLYTINGQEEDWSAYNNSIPLIQGYGPINSKLTK
jgi:Tfp pilus assembly protein PilE